MFEEWLYVMDYCNGGIYEIKLTPEEQQQDIDMQVFLAEFGLKDDECSWMFTTNRIVMIDKLERI